jgi:hypothetical protein
MKVVKIVLVILISLACVAAAAFFLIGYFKPRPGGILVNSSPVASVYINGILVGSTPYQGYYQAGEIDLKLVPNTSDTSLIPYEIKIPLIPEIQTVVGREFGKSEDSSSGDVIYFEKTGGEEADLVVTSTPENSEVSVDGVPQGFAPYKTSTIAPAEHQITIKAPGYVNRNITVKTLIGYSLTLFAQLAEGNLQPSPSPSPAPPQIMVQIENTQTGYLKVRSQPGTAGEVIAQVKPGNMYPYLNDDTATGWLEIQYEPVAPGLPEGIVGWVSNQFAKKITVYSSTPSGSINATSSAGPVTR